MVFSNSLCIPRGKIIDLSIVLSIFMVGMIVPSNDPELLRSTGTAAQSPFVIAANNAGIKVVPSIINAIVLTSAWSAGNAGECSFIYEGLTD